MIDSELIFLDTAPIIYIVENNPNYYSRTSSYFTKMIQNNANFVTSVISIAEFGVKPKRIKKLELIEEMEEMLKVFEIQTKEITRSIAELSSTIRANYPFLQNFDALQLSTAVEFNCTVFLTNDKKLKNIKDLNVKLTEDLSNDY